MGVLNYIPARCPRCSASLVCDYTHKVYCQCGAKWESPSDLYEHYIEDAQHLMKMAHEVNEFFDLGHQSAQQEAP